MTSSEVDAHLAQVPEPGRSTLAALRASILAVVPDPEQGISYGVPAFFTDGRVVAGDPLPDELVQTKLAILEA